MLELLNLIKTLHLELLNIIKQFHLEQTKINNDIIENINEAFRDLNILNEKLKKLKRKKKGDK